MVILVTCHSEPTGHMSLFPITVKKHGNGLKTTNRNRRSIRLRGYDYSHAGAYFVTICTRNRACLFGEIVVGEMVKTVWNKLPDRFPNIDLDAFIIMPNHIHGIVVLVGAPLVGAHSDNVIHGATVDRSTTRVAPTVGDVVGAFKSLVTVEYTRGVKQSGWTRFDGKLWQRNYYEHIIRDENELNLIRQYIINNPLKWDSDRENPVVRALNAVPQQQKDEPWKNDIPHGHDASG